ncbi:Peptide/nickel transport system ATP-binding protein [Paraburkholderia tropica]|uniref:ABC transporter ATP-binding protein n=1 Tax=Paraburkholderia tropica TaxID=92647 RepID=UPI001CABCB6E|nr:ABC transporter ATP-binding protein [Paraburkholderia tropica]CAG9202260.1 Peptide/nickel transport system ATP-binding protein [Paraburkholderia tropica]
MADEIVLRVDNLSVHGDAHSTTVLDDVSLTLRRGETLGVIGESGAGKTTLGLALLGHLRDGLTRGAGRVLLGETDVLALRPRELAALRGVRVAYVAQSAAAFNPAARLIDQVVEIAVARGLLSRRAARERAVALFAQLGLPDPEHFGERYPHEASGGQLQRAMTAMALCASPDIVVFDEPTAALDADARARVLGLIRETLAANGTAAVFISHDLPSIGRVSDALLVLRHGRVIESGRAEQVLAAPRDAYTRALLDAQRAGRDDKPLHADDGAASTPHDTHAPLFEARHIDARYPNGRVALRNVSIALHAGRTLAVVGPSGSGKSTLARIVTGLLAPSTGALRLNGAPLAPALRQRDRETLRAIQLVHQIPDLALNPAQRIGETIGHALALAGVPSRAARDAETAALLEQVGLDASHARRYPRELSGGQKQRVCIARALAARPALLVCDEPTSALDPLVGAKLLELLARLQRERRFAMLLITHDSATLHALAHDVLHLREGAPVGEQARYVAHDALPVGAPI